MFLNKLIIFVVLNVPYLVLGFLGVWVCGSNVAGVDSWEDGIAGGLKDVEIFKIVINII